MTLATRRRETELLERDSVAWRAELDLDRQLYAELLNANRGGEMWPPVANPDDTPALRLLAAALCHPTRLPDDERQRQRLDGLRAAVAELLDDEEHARVLAFRVRCALRNLAAAEAHRTDVVTMPPPAVEVPDEGPTFSAPLNLERGPPPPLIVRPRTRVPHAPPRPAAHRPAWILSRSRSY